MTYPSTHRMLHSALPAVLVCALLSACSSTTSSGTALPPGSGVDALGSIIALNSETALALPSGAPQNVTSASFGDANAGYRYQGGVTSQGGYSVVSSVLGPPLAGIANRGTAQFTGTANAITATRTSGAPGITVAQVSSPVTVNVDVGRGTFDARTQPSGAAPLDLALSGVIVSGSEFDGTGTFTNGSTQLPLRVTGSFDAAQALSTYHGSDGTTAIAGGFWQNAKTLSLTLNDLRPRQALDLVKA